MRCNTKLARTFSQCSLNVLEKIRALPYTLHREKGGEWTQMDENLREATEFPEKNETTAAKANELKTKSIHFKVSA